VTDPTIDTLARTLWGQARGCGAAGMSHVANVILNRADHPSWWGHTIAGVCTQPYQFSCRNIGDPNRQKLLTVTTADPEFVAAMSIAREAVAGRLGDMTNGADSYYALSMSTPPAWAAKAVRTTSDGWHAFYRTVAAAPPGSRPDVRNVSVHTVPAPQPAEDEADRLDDQYNPTLAE
jgi:N-acetylmuramoyl-L-alanine amidase